MIDNKTVAVVVPAYNEETQIGQVIETMPDFVDRIVIVNDASKDKTAEVVKSYWDTKFNIAEVIENLTKKEITGRYQEADRVIRDLMIKELDYFIPSEIENVNQDNERIIFINLLKNGGVGAAIARGYKWCKDYGIDCTAVMAGDGQMDPDELEGICLPVIQEKIDYVKGNRLIHKSASILIPKVRFFGNSILSMLTKISSGYWYVSDTQTGYTAMSNRALNSIKLHKIYKRYGMPNDMLVKLNIAMCSLKEVEIKPIYNVGEKSKMKIHKIVIPVSFLLFRSFFKRILTRYFIKDFHPLFLLYLMSFILFGVSIPFMVKIFRHAFIYSTDANPVTVLAFVFLFISSFQSLLFAMWMDVQDNNRFYKS
jgi:glycosyltransferase involved in cell wall biosynthesis